MKAARPKSSKKKRKLEDKSKPPKPKRQRTSSPVRTTSTTSEPTTTSTTTTTTTTRITRVSKLKDDEDSKLEEPVALSRNIIHKYKGKRAKRLTGTIDDDLSKNVKGVALELDRLDIKDLTKPDDDFDCIPKATIKVQDDVSLSFALPL